MAMPPSPPLVLPRGLIFLASLWLIGSWVVAIGLRTPVQPSAASYEPSVRLMVICLAMGLTIGWPMLRLSQTPSAFPIRQALLDLIVLLALVQVVLWPLRLVTTWSPPRTAALDATLAGWALVCGAILAATLGSHRRGLRNLAMAACMGLCLLGPAAAWLGVVSGVDSMHLLEVSPLMAVVTLGRGGGAPLTSDQWVWIAGLGIAAAAAWAAAGLVVWARVRRSLAGGRGGSRRVVS